MDANAADMPASSVYTDPADTVSTTMGQTATGNLLDNAKLPAGTTAQVTGFSIAGSTTVYPAGSNVTLTDPVTGEPIGTLAIAADGSYTFDPVDGYIGPTPAISVYSKNSNGQTAVSAITLDVLAGEQYDRVWCKSHSRAHNTCKRLATGSGGAGCLRHREGTIHSVPVCLGSYIRIRNNTRPCHRLPKIKFSCYGGHVLVC
jgi:hypothetical protein